MVEVTTSNITGKNEVVWAGFADKTPYRINGILGINTGFKLAPGVTMEMNRDALIQINDTGYLSAKGTPTQKVIFTSTDRTAAYWRGIISYSPDAKNELENAEVNNAGSSSIVSNRKANIAVWGTHATINITKTRISGSGGYGVFVGYGSSGNADLSTANTFDNNALVNVLIDK